jgi:hypothetical protein
VHLPLGLRAAEHLAKAKLAPKSAYSAGRRSSNRHARVGVEAGPHFTGRPSIAGVEPFNAIWRTAIGGAAGLDLFPTAPHERDRHPQATDA